MDIIKDKQQAIDGLNEVLDHSENAESVAQHLDDMIFDYIYFQATSGGVISEYENDRIITARLVRDFFYSLKNNSNLTKYK